MAKKHIHNPKRHIETTCGIAALFPNDEESYDIYTRMENIVRDKYNNDYFLAMINNPRVKINRDKNGFFAGDKRGEYPEESLWDNLYAYFFWEHHKTRVQQYIDSYIADHPSAAEKIAAVYQWARELVCNEEANHHGMGNISEVHTPEFDPLNDAGITADRFGEYTGEQLMAIVQKMAMNYAPPEVINQTINNVCEQIDNVISECMYSIDQFIASIHHDEPTTVQQDVRIAAYTNVPQGVAQMNYVEPQVQASPVDDISGAVVSEAQTLSVFDDIGPINFDIDDPTEFVHPNDPRFQQQSMGYHPYGGYNMGMGMGAYPGGMPIPQQPVYYGNGGMNGNF